jgi:hypothetical protein
MHAAVSTDSSPRPQHADPGALRRAVACARTLLDELERCVVRSPDDAVGRQGLARQAAEELERLATLLAPSFGNEVLQDAE